MKKALFTQVCDGITYERGKVYNDEEVAHLPATDFEDTNAVSETVIDSTNTAVEDVTVLDTEEEKKEEVITPENSEVVEDENKGTE